MRARLEGVALDSKAVPDGAMRKYLGADLAMADVSVAYRLDAVNQVLEPTQLEIDLRGLVRLELGADHRWRDAGCGRQAQHRGRRQPASSTAGPRASGSANGHRLQVLA